MHRIAGNFFFFETPALALLKAWLLHESRRH
jgi:hypothetical protein